jgi:S1-C subfamily serine protease
MAEERLGFNVEPLRADVAEELGYDDSSGVIVADVARGSAAARRNLAAYRNWRLTRINETAIESTADVRRALENVQADEIVSLHLEDWEETTAVVNIRVPQ